MKRRFRKDRNNCCLLFVACLTSQQHANVSQGRICSYNFTCWDRSCRSSFRSHLVTLQWHRANQSQHWLYNANHWYDSTPEKSRRERDSNPGYPRRRNATTFMVGLENGHIRTHLTQKRSSWGTQKKKKNPGSSVFEADALTSRPTRRPDRNKECTLLRSYYFRWRSLSRHVYGRYRNRWGQRQM